VQQTPWFSGRSAHAALLPVATTRLPPHPTGVLPPSAPDVNLVATNGSIRVYWAKPPSSDAVTQYVVTATTPNMFAPTRQKSEQVAGSATAATLLGLTNGSPYDVDVRAWNIAGSTDSAPVRTTPMLPPSAPTNMQVQVNPSTSTATVTWDFTAAPGTEPVRAFSVWTGSPGGPVVSDLPPDARTATFTAASAWTGTVSVHAEGVAQDGVASVNQVSFPGPDNVAPTANLEVPAAVALSHSLSVVLGASDDRQLAAGGPIDVRWRTATRGHRLGTWSSPPAWQGLPTGPLAITGLIDGQTVCLSARAHDGAGNVSPWTNERCVAVALDDRAMTRSSGTKILAGSSISG
jgi:hypothetical protein